LDKESCAKTQIGHGVIYEIMKLTNELTCKIFLQENQVGSQKGR